MNLTEKAKGIFDKYSKQNTIWFASDGQPFFSSNAAFNHSKTLKDSSITIVQRNNPDGTTIADLSSIDRSKLESLHSQVTGKSDSATKTDAELSLELISHALKEQEPLNHIMVTQMPEEASALSGITKAGATGDGPADAKELIQEPAKAIQTGDAAEAQGGAAAEPGAAEATIPAANATVDGAAKTTKK